MAGLGFPLCRILRVPYKRKLPRPRNRYAGAGSALPYSPTEPFEAFREIWAGLTVHGWDRQFMERAVDLTLKLIGDVPVYRYICTPDASAVQYLEARLEEDFAYGN